MKYKRTYIMICGIVITTFIFLTSTASASVNKDSALIKQVQEALNSKGYDAGPCDGIEGKQTHQAIEQYKSLNDLPVSTDIDEKFLDSLGIVYLKDNESVSSTTLNTEIMATGPVDYSIDKNANELIEKFNSMGLGNVITRENVNSYETANSYATDIVFSHMIFHFGYVEDTPYYQFEATDPYSEEGKLHFIDDTRRLLKAIFEVTEHEFSDYDLVLDDIFSELDQGDFPRWNHYKIKQFYNTWLFNWSQTNEKIEMSFNPDSYV